MGVVTDMAGECGLGVVVQANSYTARDGGPEKTWLSEGTEDTTLCEVCEVYITTSWKVSLPFG